MTPKQRDVIERAREVGGRVIEIDRKEGRVYRETPGRNTLKKLAKARNEHASAVLHAELERLAKIW